MKKITVLLAEDHTVVREGLRSLMLAEDDIEVVAEVETGREAVRRVTELRPDVVVMDLAMPLLNGMEASRQILKVLPATKIIILSAHGDDEYVEQAIGVGAAGYLVKQTSVHILTRAIHEVLRGKLFFSDSISRRRQDRRERSGPNLKGLPVLSSREIEVLQLIAEGKANKQTAAELGISIKTVEKHRQHLMSKLDIHDTAGLTRYAISSGIIEGGARIKLE